jgi:hypothetical protein
MRFLFMLFALLFIAAPVRAESLAVSSGLLSISSAALNTSSLSIEGDGFSLSGNDEGAPLAGMEGTPGALVPFDAAIAVHAGGTFLGATYPFCSAGTWFTCPSLSVHFSGALPFPTEELTAVSVTVPVDVSGAIANFTDPHSGSYPLLMSGIARFELQGAAPFGLPFRYTVGEYSVSFAQPIPEPAAWLLWLSGIAAIVARRVMALPR